MALVILCGVLAFVVFLVFSNIRDRKTEKALAQLRGAQVVASFAEMFSTDAERAVARTLYPRFEQQTATRNLPLAREDKLFSPPYSGSILSEQATAHCLRFLEEDLFDAVLAVLRELGCDAPQTVVADELDGVETVGQLITALARVTAQPVNR
jgi:hypothetical protein